MTIRKGDKVKVVKPEILIRCGYPKTVDDYYEEAKKLAAIFPFPERNIRKIAREIAYGLACGDGFGGRERTLHLEEKPEIMGEVFEVEDVKTVVTGRYFPPQSWTSYDGEYDYEPGGLQNEKRHRIAHIKLNFFGDMLKIPVVNLELVLPKAEHAL